MITPIIYPLPTITEKSRIQWKVGGSPMGFKQLRTDYLIAGGYLVPLVDLPPDTPVSIFYYGPAGEPIRLDLQTIKTLLSGQALTQENVTMLRQTIV